ncbi:hypothetical protein B0H12DRAFT_388934 [Mycena haematopus]|nr:hypothetical protein B0H12DRAFT_388934 [Mycena haematopus]
MPVLAFIGARPSREDLSRGFLPSSVPRRTACCSQRRKTPFDQILRCSSIELVLLNLRTSHSIAELGRIIAAITITWPTFVSACDRNSCQNVLNDASPRLTSRFPFIFSHAR